MPLKLDLSRKLQQQAEKVIPGGVDSPARAFKSVGGDPPFIIRGEGARLFDADGNSYIDYVGSWGPLILGHCFPAVVDAIHQAAESGTSFGASTPSEARLAALVLQAYPNMQQVRFVSSGTEATMSAIRLARAYTKRKYIIKFDGCYHGHSDGLLVKGGSGLATLGIPDSAGVLPELAHFTLSLPYNDADSVQQAFAKFKGEIACVIVEPVVGNMGCVPPAPGYLEALRDVTKKDGALLVFDEVMTGFRIAFGGAQEIYHVAPDITTLGKIIGGGLPVGAYASTREIMQMVSPLGPMYQAGTLSGNPLAMAAGIAALTHLHENRNIYDELESDSMALADGVKDIASAAGHKIVFNRVGSMFTWFFQSGNVWDWTTASKSDLAKFGKFHRAMLENGIYLPPSQYEAAFLSAAHTQDDLEATFEAARVAFKNL